jgi:dipeptidyl aminopeptidase/acylaminoacyl peptidase
MEDRRRRSLPWVALVVLAAVRVFAAPAPPAAPQGPARFEGKDVFELEWAAFPEIAPDGQRVVYERHSMDVMTDRRRVSLWIVGADGRDHRPLVGGEGAFLPRWSPDGSRLLYASRDGDGVQLYVRYLDTGQTSRLTHVRRAPNAASWSPDGRSIAFTMLVPSKAEPFAVLPDKPEGAVWADPPKVIQKLVYRADGEGYLEGGFVQLFLLPAEGGTPRQLTTGEFNVSGRPAFTPDGRAVLFSSNRRPDSEYEPNESEIYELSLAEGALRALTDRRGPDFAPAVSPDGRQVAYLGFDDRYQGYQVTHLYVMNRDGSSPRRLAGDLDRDASDPVWSGDGKGVFFSTADHGNGKVAYVAAAGAAKVEILASDLGGGDLGRPYGGGTFSVSMGGRIAYSLSRPEIPGDVALAARGIPTKTLTHLNDDLLPFRQLASTEETTFESSFDHRKIQGWIVKPPGFDATKRYPLILEIHGGPFSDYGDRFGAEMQLYAAAGYVVLYLNPRGSTSYGEEFGNLIHHDYPGHDYEDLMSGVDGVLAKGYVDPEQLFVTGGSGGGVLTAWIVGKTDRFRAAVSAKPVINWASFVLTSDGTNFFTRYWFAAPPWEKPEEYLRRSPLQYVGNVKTPTMLLTGEQDFRTPISEAEQFFTALKLRKVDTALVRFPGASHDLITRPSQLIAKVSYILAWFEKHRPAAR